MKQKSNTMMVIGLAVALCVAADPVFAQPQNSGASGGHWDQSGHDGKRGGGMRLDGGKGPDFEEMVEKLGLTEEQQAQLKEHRQQKMQQARGIREQLKAKKEEIRQELQKEPFDVARIKAVHEQIKALVAQREDDRLEGILKMREVLTAEQFQKVHDRMEQGRERFKERFKERRGDVPDMPPEDEE